MPSLRKKLNYSTKSKSVQEIQDEIFRKMSAEKKLKLASDFSMFCLKLHQIGQSHGLSKTSHKNRQDF